MIDCSYFWWAIECWWVPFVEVGLALGAALTIAALYRAAMHGYRRLAH